MKVRIAIEQEFDLSDESIFDDEANKTSTDTKVDYLVARFCEDIDNLVKHDEVWNVVLVEYIED